MAFAAPVLVVVLLQFAGILSAPQNYILEKRSKYSPRPASGQIVFIGIDKKSIDQVGIWPWPRSIYAEAIDRLINQEVAEIVLDVDFSTPSSSKEDKALAQALRASGGGVILPSFLQESTVDTSSSLVELSKPLDIFAEEAWLAMVNVVPDSDGVIRTYPYGSDINGEITPSLSNLISGNGRIDSSSFNIDFSIEPSSIPSYPFADLISGQLVNAELKGKTVVVGAAALELGDKLTVPVHGVIAGPILQIVAAETLLQRRQLNFTNLIFTLVFLILICPAAAWASKRMRLPHKLLGLASAVVAIEFIGFYLQAQFAIVLVSAPILILASIAAMLVTAADYDLKSLLLRIAKLEVQNAKNLLDQVFSDSFDAILIINENGTVIEMNHRFRDLIGNMKTHSSRNSISYSVPRSFIDEGRSVISEMKAGKATPSRTGHLAITNSSQEKYIEYSVTPSRISNLANIQHNEPEEHFVACVIARDITQQTNQKNQIIWQSTHDILTGTERRSEFILRLDTQIRKQPITPALIQVFTLGIYRFGVVGATLGREVGDGLLREFAERLEKLGQFVEGVSRLDSANFAIRVNLNHVGEKAADLPARLLQEMSMPYRVNDQQINIDLCIGYEEIAPDSVSAAEYLEHAEFALDEALKTGPNSICVFNPAFYNLQKKARWIESEMEHALNAGQFSLVYQPQVMARDGVPCGAEALVRWNHQKLGAISPADFIKIAEASGIIEKIGRFALNQACHDAVAWPQNIKIAVNVSPLQFVRGDIVRDVQTALRVSGLAANRLELEITESSFLTNTDSLLYKLKALKNLGVGLSMDDFGTGYSSLGYFNKYPLDKIKVDQVFIKGIETNSANQLILKSIKTLAEGMGTALLCEGVETNDELQTVRLLGCDQIQGYYFSKPQSMDEISTYFAHSLKSVA